MEKLKNKKIQYTLTFGVVAGAVLLFQGIMPNKMPKIDSISPNQGSTGTQVIIYGSGFSTSTQGIVGTRVKDKVLNPGNYVLVKDEPINQPVLSPDGKTLIVRLDLVSQIAKRECEEKFSRKDPQPCRVPIKVINAYSQPSNDFIFTFTGREIKKLTYSLEKLPMPVPAVIHPMLPGELLRDGEEMMRVRVSAPSTNEQAISGIEINMATYAHADPIGVPCTYFYLPSYVWIKNLSSGNESGGLLVGGASPLVQGGCTITFSLGPLEPGTHIDFAIKANMFAPPATAKTFTMLAGAMSWYVGPGYYVIDNGLEDIYPGLGVTSGIESDPVQIVLP